ncbi:uncharacterized protein LOC8284478 [Ricinus communis]|uniref:Calmodulin-binding domain-containing protein n=1 Tax=Ricinus communis TaxID=3988 RepID=B9RLT4_RICCO|nr:uncharacterized protein LOC8284478 [Ricinus communis]EEF47809.1 conserved hypothetical protein [Ricinus communis]|eukprot:XP_002514703.1 uncharacterized protein LOC8284478 [Ricinus communis]
MIAEKLDVIPESDGASMIPESNSIPVIQERISLITETDSASELVSGSSESKHGHVRRYSATISLIPETDSDSSSLVPESDSAKVVSGSCVSKHGHVRRFSTGNIGIPYKSVKILSRYLAASTGSCHDNCKYGTRQDPETKTPNSPVMGKRMEKQGKSQEIGKTLTLAERKMKLAVSFTPSSGSKCQKPDFSVLTKTSSLCKRETVLLKQHSLPLKEVVPKPKSMLSKSSTLPIKQHSCSKEDGVGLYKDNEMGLSLLNPPRSLSSREQNKLRSIKEKKTSMLDERKDVARATVSSSAMRTVKKVLRRPIVSLSPKRSDKRVSSVDTEEFKSLKGVSRLKDLSDVGEAKSEQPSSDDGPEKTSHVIEISDISIFPSTVHKDKSLKHAQVSSSLEHKLLRRTKFGIRDSQSPSSPEKNSLRRIKQGTRAIRSSISSLASPNYRQSGSFSEYHETDNEKDSATAKIDLKSSPRKGVVVSSKDKGSLVRKLSFRKGKVLELCPVITSPKRLKFRRRHKDSQISKVEKIDRNFKNTGTHVDDGEISVTKSEGKKVVLKHQKIEGKKVVKNLLNNMIEETANKLAETKKSKVKALVGAFETVISLQDSKPLPTADA